MRTLKTLRKNRISRKKKTNFNNLTTTIIMQVIMPLISKISKEMIDLSAITTIILQLKMPVPISIIITTTIIILLAILLRLIPLVIIIQELTIRRRKRDL